MPGEWTAAEDALLVQAATKYGGKRWSAVAVEVKSRNATQCCQRWNNALRPDLSKGSWTEEEDAVLIGLVRKFGTNWPEISKNWPLDARATKQIRERWRNV